MPPAIVLCTRFAARGLRLPVVEAMACGLPVIVTGAGPVLDYATEETAFFIPARRGKFAECRVGDIETIGRPWLWEPDQDALVEHLRRVAADPAAARAKGSAASAWIREHFTWARAAEAVEKRLRVLAAEGEGLAATELPARRATGPSPKRKADPRSSGAVHPPQHGAVAAGAAGRVPRTSPAAHAKVSLTMIVKDEEKNLPHCSHRSAGCSMRSSSWTRAARIARLKSPGRSGRGCLICRGLMTSPPLETPPWRGPRAIMHSGSMPTTWSSRRNERSSRRCSGS